MTQKKSFCSVRFLGGCKKNEKVIAKLSYKPSAVIIEDVKNESNGTNENCET